ncbi:hypothetical protein KL920_005433, partial [Ogataea angusta]
AACRVLPDADGGGGRRPGGHAAGPQHGAAHAQPVCAVALPAHGGRGAVGRAARARGGAHPRGQRAGHGPLLQGHDPQPAPAAQAQPDREQPAERHHGAGRGRRVVRGRAEGGGAARRRGPASRWPRSSSRPTAVCAWARTRTAGGSRRSSSACSSRWTRCSAGPTRRARRWSARSRTASSRRRSTASTTAGPTSTSASPRRPASTATSASTCWPRPPPPGARAPRS